MRNYGIKALHRVAGLGVCVHKQLSEAAQKIAASCHHNGEHGGNHRSGLDGSIVLYGIELLHHLRQSPCTKRCKYHNAYKIYRVRPEQ